MPVEVRARVANAPHALADYLHSIPDDHPVQIALRTYGLALSLALGPALLPFLTSRKARAQGFVRVLHILRRELGPTSFASAITIGIAGGAAIRYVWDDQVERHKAGEHAERPEILVHAPDVSGDHKSRRDRWEGAARKARLLAWKRKVRAWLAGLELESWQKTFVSNMISSFVAMTLFHSKRLVSKKPSGRPSPTLDLTLLFLVRAMDCLVQMALFKPTAISELRFAPEERERRKKDKRKWSTRLDALVFWVCSARIMWCFFYAPERLPRSYNKWIMTLANIDPRLLLALRGVRNGTFSYKNGISVPRDLITSYASELGYSAKWGDPVLLPAHGGPSADAVWKSLGVTGRNGLGGMPCELVHGNVTGGSCTSNAVIRGAYAFAEAVALYLPVHVLPILLTRPHKLLDMSKALSTALSVLRSATFLSTFVSSVWMGVCLTRTLLLARLFPRISHDFWDGPQGCALVGSMAAGASIWIERGRRRGEMALYVMPRAIRAWLPEKWLTSGKLSVRWAERLMFVLSLAALLTASRHRADSLRGLSRWTLAFVMKGPNAGFWRRKRLGTNAPPTPAPERGSPAPQDEPATVQS